MNNLTEHFASMVFDDKIMKEVLPKKIYASLKKTISEQAELDEEIAEAVAEAMKNWAIERGATHFTHWFQPLTGITAEKHDGFLSPAPNGRIIMNFSGKELIKGEPDASSFPSGGLRATFEARGYTAWDPTSYAFVKDHTLYIPTAFCSYGGEALDKKTPLLRSMDALNKQALRVLRLFGDNTTKRVVPFVGPEQEYFLIDENLYEKREDLIITGRTLFGASAPKGQQLDDHYFGAVSPKINAFWQDLNERLWKLGIMAKTEHNEVAPAQHELAPIYSIANVAADHNQLTMEIMKATATKHGLRCLLHEKPFDGLNGSGKHNNWSIGTDTGENLLSPGDHPSDNKRFLLFLCAIIKAVDDYQDLLRISVSSAGNDHRLGANEAPPAIISIFLGDRLTEVLNGVKTGKKTAENKRQKLNLGAEVLPEFAKDYSDRNRTSPFAFTGNKFEFRMLGSADSISCANVMINTAVAESLKVFADRLEKTDNFEKSLFKLLQETIIKHERIIFNGNGYSKEWVEEAQKRGLNNYPTTPDCLVHLTDEKNARLLLSHKVYTAAELKSRQECLIENYCNTVMIEAGVMIDMAKKQILPSVLSYVNAMLKTIGYKKQFFGNVARRYETDTVTKLSNLSDEIFDRLEKLEKHLNTANAFTDNFEKAFYIRDNILPSMSELRIPADQAELLTAEKYWQLPTYTQMLFGNDR